MAGNIGFGVNHTLYALSSRTCIVLGDWMWIYDLEERYKETKLLGQRGLPGRLHL
ncbi:MAG: hypothetical protein NTV59_01325 [Chloroflexi bacterium]|nr:hypothetical protein [Chloroflexota bacterium]